jgi:hypothetical protein
MILGIRSKGREVYILLYEIILKESFIMELKFEHLNEVITRHTPAVLVGMGIIGSVMNGTMIVNRIRKYKELRYKIKYEVAGTKCYLTQSLWVTKSNNWLKAHGYPMKRKH